MRLTIVQFTPRFRDKGENWRRILQWADSGESDVVLFPELSSCGYCFEDAGEIRGCTDTSEALAPLEEIARRRGRLLVGGFAEEASEGLFNSAFVVSPEGTKVFRKIHLWDKEKLIFQPGSEPLMVDFGGHRFGVEICYDLQFPELASFYSHQGAEVLLVPMAWTEESTGPLRGLAPYNHLAIATAISHGMFVAVANRTGLEKEALFAGESSVCDPNGRLQTLPSGEDTLSLELDFALVAPAKRPNPRNDLDADARIGLIPPVRDAT